VIQWSYSSLKDFVNCPRQYYEVKVAKSVVKKVTEQMLYGTEVHKAVEDYVREGKPLAKHYSHYKPVLDELLKISGTRYPEYQMALKIDKTVCAFEDEARWVRGIVDLLIVDGENAFIVDYKTGSNKYPDPKQLKLMALMTYAHFPKVQNIKAGLLFITRNTFVPEEYARSDINKLWMEFKSDLTRLELAYENNMWPEKPTGLCGWCPVEKCKFYKVR
jgi:CRISPR/Cas system-associated exonuclease Cas4 (RecB family)